MLRQVEIKVNKRTRNRITGVVLLLILAAVLTPMVFRSPEQIRNALDMRIPEQPEVEVVTVEPVVAEPVVAAAAERIELDRAAVQRGAGEQIADQPPLPVAVEAPAMSETKPENAPEPAPAPEPAQAEPAPPALESDESPVLAGFVVQVGSYANGDNAAALVDKLKAAGYRAYSETDSAEGRLVHRVMVGPELRKEDAELTRQLLADDERFGFKGLVRIYAP